MLEALGARFWPASGTFFGSIEEFNKNLISNITYGVANSKKKVRNPLNPSETFFAD